MNRPATRALDAGDQFHLPSLPPQPSWRILARMSRISMSRECSSNERSRLMPSGWADLRANPSASPLAKNQQRNLRFENA
jgi:hypothetical protein